MRKELKRFERAAEKGTKIQEGILKLVGVDVDLKNSEIVLEKDNFDEESFNKYFVVKTGEWYVEDGWVVGKNPNMCPGMIISKDNFLEM